MRGLLGSPAQSTAAKRRAARGRGGPIPGNVPGQAGRGSEQPGLAEDVPAHRRGLG